VAKNYELHSVVCMLFVIGGLDTLYVCYDLSTPSSKIARHLEQDT